MRRAAGLLAAALIAAGPLSAQQAAGPAPAHPTAGAAPRAPTRVTFTATDSTLRGPATFRSGAVTLQLTNRGTRPHMMQLVAIGPGHTYQEALTLLKTNNRPPVWTSPVIAVGPVDPGKSVAVTLNLDPLEYLLADGLTTNDKPNYLRGMTAPVEGRGETVADLPNLPVAGGLLVTDRVFRFGLMLRSGNTWRQVEGPSRVTQISNGTQSIRIDASTAQQVHSIVLARGGPEVMRDYVSWLNGRRAAPPPIYGGIPNLRGGQVVYLEVTLPGNGTYVLFCTMRHARYGTLGYESGEFAQFVAR